MDKYKLFLLDKEMQLMEYLEQLMSDPWIQEVKEQIAEEIVDVMYTDLGEG